MLGSLQEHIDKAQNDLRLVQKLLNSDEFLDWGIVALFYFSLHCVNAHAARYDITEFEKPIYRNMDEHVKRIKYAQKKIDKEFAKLYNKLYNKSKQCRYDSRYYLQIRKERVQKLYDDTTNICVRCHLFPPPRI